MLGEVVILGFDAVQMIDIDVIGAEQLEALLQPFDNLGVGVGVILWRQGFFCRDHQLLARHTGDGFADDRLRAVGLGGI